MKTCNLTIQKHVVNETLSVVIAGYTGKLSKLGQLQRMWLFGT